MGGGEEGEVGDSGETGDGGDVGDVGEGGVRGGDGGGGKSCSIFSRLISLSEGGKIVGGSGIFSVLLVRPSSSLGSSSCSRMLTSLGDLRSWL